MSGVGSNDGGAETGISSQEALESMYPRRDPHVTGRKRSMRDRAKACGKSVCPVATWLPKYTTLSARGDLAAGMTVGIMLFPQGLAYASLAGLPPVYGLYASLTPLIVYFLMGTGRHVSVGPFALVSLLVAKACTDITPATDPPSTEYINAAIVLAFMTGAVTVVLYFLRLGFLAVFLSASVVSGFTTGAAFLIGVTQLKDITGVTGVGRYSGVFGFFETIAAVAKAMPETFNVATFVVGAVTILILVVCRWATSRLKAKFPSMPPIPGELLVVVFGTLVSYALDLGAKADVEVVGTIHAGFPHPAVPAFTGDLVSTLLPSAVLIAVVGYVISVSIAKTFSNKHGYKIDSNQELLALGLTNLIGPFFLSYTASASLSRSAVLDAVGGHTQLSGLFSFVIVAVILIFLAPLFAALPTAVLAAIILVALRGMIAQFREVPVLWRLSRSDCVVWVASFLCTIVCGVEVGLILAIGVSLGSVIWQRSHPKFYTLLRVPGSPPDRPMFCAGELYGGLQHVPGVKIARMEAQLSFINVEAFLEGIKDLADRHALNERYLVLHCGSFAQPDAPSLRAIVRARELCKERQYTLLLSDCPADLCDGLKRVGYTSRVAGSPTEISLDALAVPPDFFTSVGAAVAWAERSLNARDHTPIFVGSGSVNRDEESTPLVGAGS